MTPFTQVRFQRKAPIPRVIVYYKGERMGQARPLDAVANDRPKKPKSDPGQAAGAVPLPPHGPPPLPAGAAVDHDSQIATPKSQIL